VSDFLGVPVQWVLGPFGAVVILLAVSYLGLKGLIIPKSVVSRMMDEQRKAFEAAAKAIGLEITKGMQEAVHKGIKTGLADGYLRMVKLNGERRPEGKSRRRKG
jgi:hypothetical protein